MEQLFSRLHFQGMRRKALEFHQEKGLRLGSLPAHFDDGLDGEDFVLEKSPFQKHESLHQSAVEFRHLLKSMLHLSQHAELNHLLDGQGIELKDSGFEDFLLPVYAFGFRGKELLGLELRNLYVSGVLDLEVLHIISII